MRLNWAFALVFASTLPVLAVAEIPGTTETTTAAPAGGPASFYGRLELRPTWGTSTGIVDAWNNAEVGYNFSANTKVLFNQSFNFDLRNSVNKDVNFILPDARIELDLNRVWTDRRAAWALDYQPRLHVPTDTGRRDLGLITEFRHQFNLTKTFAPNFQLQTSLIPAVHAYSRRGGKDATGASTATPFFENRLEVTARWFLARNWKLEVPVKFWQTRFQNFAAGAVHNDAWAFLVQVKPEVQWQFAPNVAVGVAFETGNFFSDDLKQSTFASAFRNAHAQMVLIATL
jgi:hypothetical protein